MSKQFPIGWCEEAGRSAGEQERGNYAVTQPSARRPSGWKPGRARPSSQNALGGHRGAEVTNRKRALSRKLDQHLGVADAEGEE